MEELKCPYCKNIVKESDKFCNNCTYPLKGTEKEKSIFVGQQILNKDTKIEAKSFRLGSMIILILIGVWYSVDSIIFGIKNTMTIGYFVQLIIGIIFLILGVLTKRRPQFSLITGIVLLLINGTFIFTVSFNNYTPGMEEFSDFIGFFIKESVKIAVLSYALYKTREEIEIKKKHRELIEQNSQK